MNRLKYFAALMLSSSLLVSGCATQAPDPGRPAGSDPASAAQAPKVQHELQNPAVLALWRDAETARDRGDTEVAASAIERALRIAPGDPVLWSRLAEFRLQSGQLVQAENLASKSNALAAQNPTLRYRNWLIIGAARKQREDLDGARAAQVESERLRQAIMQGQ